MTAPRVVAKPPPADPDPWDYYLVSRAARCVAWARSGQATVLLINENQRERARELVGDAPVIISTAEQWRVFQQSYGRRPGR